MDELTSVATLFSNNLVEHDPTTRPYLPNYAVLDLTESLVDDEVAIPISARRRQRPRTEPTAIGNELRRVDNGTPLDLGLTAPFGLSDNNEVLMLRGGPHP